MKVRYNFCINCVRFIIYLGGIIIVSEVGDAQKYTFKSNMFSLKLELNARHSVHIYIMTYLSRFLTPRTKTRQLKYLVNICGMSYVLINKRIYILYQGYILIQLICIPDIHKYA